ncbi:MAG: M57 family metalloprotease, partial [Chitinophagaceae bacterium]
EGYLVEGDIILTEKDLQEAPSFQSFRFAETEQYSTTNLVKPASRTITVSGPTSPAEFSVAIDSAIDRYNKAGTTLTFQRQSTGADIAITLINTGQYIASSGFPSSTGVPYGSVNYAKKYSTNYSIGFMTTVITHEIGHCIGFRHTDYMNRSFSCGTGGNEGNAGVGAVLIHGTPSDPEKGSWMLACLSSSSNRKFTANDITALKYLY